MSWERAKDLPERLKATREALGLTQEDFGELMGVVGQSISDYETGRSQPSRSRLERLAKRLGIPIAGFSKETTVPLARIRSLAAAQKGLERPSVRENGQGVYGTQPRGEQARKILELRLEAAVLEGVPVEPAEVAGWFQLVRWAATPGVAGADPAADLEKLVEYPELKVPAGSPRPLSPKAKALRPRASGD